MMHALDEYYRVYGQDPNYAMKFWSWGLWWTIG